MTPGSQGAAATLACMSPRIWMRTAFVGMVLACNTQAEPQADGACVPGASAMCWCDGMTPGVQECLPDETFAPCVCDGGTGGGDGSGAGDAATGDGTGGSDAGPGNDTDPTGPTDPTNPTDPETSDSGGETTGADEDTGDPVPTDCTDELFSLWQACRQLAGLNNPSGCGPCAGGNSCENAACNVDCLEQGNPGLEADLAACDGDYPQCAGIFDQPTDPYVACTQMCGADFNECLAALAPGCDPTAAGSCSSDYAACVNGC